MEASTGYVLYNTHSCSCPAHPGYLQLAQTLLQLQHYGACVSVAVKASADARLVGDVVWGVRLQQLQANALAAEGDAAGALTALRDAMSR